MDEKTVKELRELINNEIRGIKWDLDYEDPINEWKKGRVIGMMFALYYANAISEKEYRDFFDMYK